MIDPATLHALAAAHRAALGCDNHISRTLDAAADDLASARRSARDWKAAARLSNTVIVELDASIEATAPIIEAARRYHAAVLAGDGTFEAAAALFAVLEGMK